MTVETVANYLGQKILVLGFEDLEIDNEDLAKLKSLGIPVILKHERSFKVVLPNEKRPLYPTEGNYNQGDGAPTFVPRSQAEAEES